MTLEKWKAVPLIPLNRFKKYLNSEKTLAPDIVHLFKWFQTLPFEQIYNARGIVSEAMWEGFDLYELSGLQEQIIFNNAREAMIQAWKEWFAKELTIKESNL